MRVEERKTAQLAMSLTLGVSLLAAVALMTSSDLFHRLPRSSMLFYISILLAFDIAASLAYHLCSKAAVGGHKGFSLDEETGSLPKEGEGCKWEKWSRIADTCSGEPCASHALDRRDIDTMKRLPPLKIRTPLWQSDPVSVGHCPALGHQQADMDIFDLLMQETVRSLVDC